MTRITGVIIDIGGFAENTQSIMKEVIYMRKIYIKTSDIFAYKDEAKQMSKWDVIRYYLATVFNSDDYIIDAIKRIVSLIFT